MERRSAPIEERGQVQGASRDVDADETTEARDRRSAMGLSRGLVQLRAQSGGTRDEELGEDEAFQTASEGVAGAGEPLPHLGRIQESFGAFNVSGVRAHVGGEAAEAAGQLGAEAYASGDDVAFKEAPDLHTAAHEAAHAVQQRGGVQLKSNVGVAGDRYEHHADAVADAVVAGRSAEPLLAQMAAPEACAAPTASVQKRGPKKGSVDFDQAIALSKAVREIVAESNVDGHVTPESLAGVPSAYIPALSDLYFARTGRVGRCMKDGSVDLSGSLMMPEDKRSGYVSSAKRRLGPAMRIIVQQSQDKKQGKAWVASYYTKPLSKLQRGITVGTFKDAAGLAANVVYILANPSWHWKSRPDLLHGVPSRYSALAWKFWTGMAGLVRGTDSVGRGADLGTKERLQRIEEADQEIRPLLAIIDEESKDKSWVQSKYEPALALTKRAIGYDGALKKVSEVDRTLEANRDGKTPADASDQTQVLAAVAQGEQTISQIRALLKVYGKLKGGEMERTLAASLQKLASENPQVTVIKDMPVTQALRHLSGILAGAQAIWTLSSDDERLKEARKRGNVVSNIAELLKLTTDLLAGVASGVTLTTAGIALAVGEASSASQLIALGSRSIRVIGQVAGVFQLTYGIAVLLDPDSTAADRKGAILNIGLGAGGTLSLGQTTGLVSGSWGGPLTIGVLVTALELKFVLTGIAGFEKGWFQWTTGQAYRSLQEPARDLQQSAGRLATAMLFLQGVKPADEAAALEFEGHKLVAEEAANGVKRACWELISLATSQGRGASVLETWRMPGNYQEIRSQYDGLWDRYKAAKTPEEIAELASLTLNATSQVFAGFHDHACRVLQSGHGDSWLFAGIHDDACGPRDE